MADRDYRSELDALDDAPEQEVSEPQVGVSQTAREIESSGLFDRLAGQQKAEREAETGKGVFKSFYDAIHKTVIETPPAALNAARTAVANDPALKERLMLPIGAGLVASRTGVGETLLEGGKGGIRGTANTVGSFASGVEQYSRTAGADGVADVAQKTAAGLRDVATSNLLKSRVESLGKISSEKWFKDSVDYALSAVGEGVGSSAPFLAVGASPAGLPGVLGFGYTTSLGELREELKDAGVIDEPTVAKYAYLAAVPHSILDTLTERGMIKRLAPGAAKEVRRGILRLVTAGAAKEGVTEAAQRVIELATTAHANGGEAPSEAVIAALFADVEKGVDSTILESGVRGALPGTVFGGADAITQEARVRTRGSVTDAEGGAAATEEAPPQSKIIDLNQFSPVGLQNDIQAPVEPSAEAGAVTLPAEAAASPEATSSQETAVPGISASEVPKGDKGGPTGAPAAPGFAVPSEPITENWDSTGGASNDLTYVTKFVGEPGIGGAVALSDPRTALFAEDLGTLPLQDGSEAVVTKIAAKGATNEVSIWKQDGERWYRIGVAKKGSDGSLEHIVVAPSYQRQGLGRYLLDTAEREIGTNTFGAKDRSKAGAALLESVRQERMASAPGNWRVDLLQEMANAVPSGRATRNNAKVAQAIADAIRVGAGEKLSGTQRENARVTLDKALAKLAADLTPESLDLLAPSLRGNLEKVAREMMTPTQVRRLAKALGSKVGEEGARIALERTFATAERSDAEIALNSEVPASPVAETADLPQRFVDLIASGAKKTTWAKSLGIPVAELKPLIDQAVSQGFLRVDRNGNVRRTKKLVQSSVETAEASGAVTRSKAQAAPEMSNNIPVIDRLRTQPNISREISLAPSDAKTTWPMFDILKDGKKVGDVTIGEKAGYVILGPRVEAPDRGKGIGTALYEHVRAQARAVGKELVPSSNLTADGYQLWKKFDPEKVGDFVKNGDGVLATFNPRDEVAYKRNLAAMSQSSAQQKPAKRRLGEGLAQLTQKDQGGAEAVAKVVGNAQIEQPDRTSAGPVQSGRVNHLSPLSIPADLRIDRAVDARERVTGKPIASITTEYAIRLEQSENPSAIIEEIRTDKLMKKGDVHDLAALVGKAVAKYVTKKAALETVSERYEKETALSAIATSADQAGARGIRDVDGGRVGGPSSEREGGGRVFQEGVRAQSLNKIVSDATARKGAQLVLTLGKKLFIEDEVVDSVLDAIRPNLHVVPKGVKVGVLTKLEPLRDKDRVFKNVDTRGTFRAPNGSLFSLDMPRDAFLGARAFYHSGVKVIGFVRMAPASQAGDILRGGLNHEIVHALKRSEMFDRGTWSRLLAHANDLQILDMPLWLLTRNLGDPEWNKVDPKQTLASAYLEIYGNRPDLQESMNEEAVAHMVELYYHNALLPNEYGPVKDILDDILAGKVKPGQADVRDSGSVTRAAPEGIGQVLAANKAAGGPGFAMKDKGTIVLGDSDQALAAIKAYHGSPHDFDRFDSSKIGTGEGAQAYGHGMYFAESEGVARNYKTQLEAAKTSQRDLISAADTIADKHRLSQADRQFLKGVADQKWNNRETMTYAQVVDDRVKTFGRQPDDLAAVKAAAEELPTGRMYEVSIKADPEQFLDWDKPLSQQSEAVRRALESAYGKGYGSSEALTGENVALYGRNFAKHPRQPDLEGNSNLLREQGIPGIRYRDAGSRGKEGDGTYNYVVFPGGENLIDIVAKDGKPVSSQEKAAILANTESPDQVLAALAPRVGPYRPVTMGDLSKAELTAPEKSVSDLVESLTKALGLEGLVRLGRLDPGLKMSAATRGNKVMGQFSGVTGVARLALQNDLATLAHEGGHALEVRPSIRDELATLKTTHAAEIATSGANPKDLSEGFAEWFRIYLTNPQQAKVSAPGFFADFEDMLDTAEPAMLEELQEVQSGVEALGKAAPAGVVRSRVKSTVLPGRIGALKEEIADKGLQAVISDRLYAFYHAFFDARHPMKRAVKFLIDTAVANIDPTLTDKQRVVLKAIDDPYKLWRLAEHSKVHATAALQNGIIPKGQIDPVGPSYTDALTTAFGGKGRAQWTDENLELFGSYLVARRMLAEFDRFDKGELEQVPDQVISRDVWKAALAEIEKAMPSFGQGAATLDQFTQNALKLKLDNGFIGQETYDDLIQRKGYAPLNRIMDDGSPSNLMNAKGANKRRLIYKFQGSTRDFINPLESIAQDMYATQARIALNDVIKAMDRLARAAGPGGGAIAERIPAKEMKATTMDVREALKAAARAQGLSESDRGGLMDIIDDLFDQDAAATIFKATDLNERGEPIVYLWENGKKVPIRIGDNRIAKDIFEGMAAMGQPNSDWLTDMAALGTQALRAGITKAPAYILTNFLRDNVATPILSEYYTPFVTGIKGLKNVVTNDATAKRYAAFAGLMGGIDSHLIDSAAAKRDALTLRQKGFFSVPARSGLGQVWQTALRATEITEAGGRMGHFEAAYQRALKDGLKPEEAIIEAAYAAHDVMDFSRRGAKMGSAARIVAFLNAALQGMDAARRTISGERDSVDNFHQLLSPYLKAATGSPLSVAEKKALPNSARFWMKTVAIGMAGVALAALYRDDPEYEEFDDYMRSTHWFFKLNGTWIRVPKPFELAFFSNLFEAGFERIWKSNERALTQFLASLHHTMIPPHEINIMNAYYEWATGVDTFRGKQIIPSEIQKLPPEMQFSAYTSEFGKMLGKITGLSPAQIDQTMGSLFGTWGRDILGLSDFALPRVNQVTGGVLPGVSTEPRAEKSPEDYWIASRFTRRASRGALSSQEFWNQMGQNGGEFIAAGEGYKALKRAGQMRQARDLVDTLPDEEKAFAYLEGDFGEDEQDLHPLNRARQVMSAASGIRKEMVLGKLFKQGTVPDPKHKYREPEAIIVPPSVQKIVNETLEDLSMREARNALVVIGQPGWVQKEIMSTEGLLIELEKAAPEVAEEFEARLNKGKSKVYSFDAVRKIWPEVKERLLKEGPDAILGDLKAEARAD